MKKVPSQECAGATGRKNEGAQQGKCPGFGRTDTYPASRHPRRKEVFTEVTAQKDYLYYVESEKMLHSATQHYVLQQITFRLGRRKL